MEVELKETHELKPGDVILAKYVGMTYSRFKVESEPKQTGVSGKLTFEISTALGIHEISFGTQDQHMTLKGTGKGDLMDLVDQLDRDEKNELLMALLRDPEVTLLVWMEDDEMDTLYDLDDRDSVCLNGNAVQVKVD